MTFEAHQKSVQDNGNYEGVKIYCLQKLEPEQWRFCDTMHKIGKGTSARHRKRGPAGDAGFFEFLRSISGRKIPIGREASRVYFEIRTTSRALRPCVAKLSVRELEESCGRNRS